MDDFETARQLFFDGLHELQANNFQAAETHFTRSLEIVPGRVSTLNNLSAVKIRLEKFTEAEACARQAIALEDKSPEAWTNLGAALTATAHHEEALLAFDQAINCDSAYAMAWFIRAKTLLQLKRFDEALLACDQALMLESGQYDLLYTKSLILKELDRPEEARMIYQRSLEMRLASSPVHIATRHATQKADALIISQNPVIDDSLKSFERLHRNCLNYPSQLARRLSEDFHFTHVFVADALRRPEPEKIPQPDFVINNHVSGELLRFDDKLPELIALADSFRVPVVNHPAKAAQSTRDGLARLLADVPGALVPKTMRFSLAGKTREELLREIEGQFEYPLITRSLFLQRGKGMAKVDSREALLEVLASGLPEDFYVTQFVDSKGENGLFRKIRAAIVSDEIVIARVDFDTGWKVHGGRSGRRVSFYLENTHLLDVEKQICRDPEAGLGGAIQALRAIRDRIPLDVFGMDFEVDADGRVIFYEANATMNLFSTAQKEVPNPQEADDRLKLAFQRYLTSLAARH